MQGAHETTILRMHVEMSQAYCVRESLPAPFPRPQGLLRCLSIERTMHVTTETAFKIASGSGLSKALLEAPRHKLSNSRNSF